MFSKCQTNSLLPAMCLPIDKSLRSDNMCGKKSDDDIPANENDNNDKKKQRLYNIINR